MLIPTRARKVQGSALNILLQIAYYSDSQLQGWCVTPLVRLAEDLGIAESTARKGLATLVKLGLVSHAAPLDIDSRRFRHAYRVEFFGPCGGKS